MGSQLLISLIVATGAAVRGNWSPCGESLQAQIHPLGERSRGNVWGVTMTSFTVASIMTGAALTGLLGAAGSLIKPSPSVALVITALLGIVAGALDLSPVKPWTPSRQVNENWIGRYRGWVYGAAFGFQLGLGFAVFVMSWGYYAMLVAAVLTGSFWQGALIGATFGLGRGILLLLARWINSPERLKIFHTRMAKARAPVFLATGALMVFVGAIALI